MPSALIILQPDLGTSSVLVAMVMGVLLVAGAKAKYIALITVLALQHRRRGGRQRHRQRRTRSMRIEACLQPELRPTTQLRDYVFQGRNAMRAIATGGITGKGWLQGPITNTKNDIPVQWADFPFSAIGEQFGLLGCGIVIGLFALVLFRIWRIAHLSRTCSAPTSAPACSR